MTSYLKNWANLASFYFFVLFKQHSLAKTLLSRDGFELGS